MFPLHSPVLVSCPWEHHRQVQCLEWGLIGAISYKVFPSSVVQWTVKNNVQGIILFHRDIWDYQQREFDTSDIEAHCTAF